MIDKKVEQNFSNESSSDEAPAIPMVEEEVKEEQIDDTVIEPSAVNLSSNQVDEHMNDFQRQFKQGYKMREMITSF